MSHSLLLVLVVLRLIKANCTMRVGFPIRSNVDSMLSRLLQIEENAAPKYAEERGTP